MHTSRTCCGVRAKIKYFSWWYLCEALAPENIQPSLESTALLTSADQGAAELKTEFFSKLFRHEDPLNIRNTSGFVLKGWYCDTLLVSVYTVQHCN